MGKVSAFLKRKNVLFSAKRYGIDAMGAMAQGLFASLLIGTIIKTLGQQLNVQFLIDAGNFAQQVAGPAMAVSIGAALSAPQLVLYSLIAVGMAANKLGGAGGPLAVYFITIVASECGKIVSKETKVDILVTPAVTILVGVGLSVLCAPAIGAAASSVGDFIKWATNLQPLLMGILVSVVVGMALTLPISSAAICAALSLTGLAGGAAVAGCCAQMVGFAVMSFRENGVGGLVSQGLGTSMLQMPNIICNPRVWIPPTLASAITGPIATCLFHLEMNGPAVSSGMGTCGLVGQIGVYTGWLNDIAAGTKAAILPMDWVGLILICFVLPAVLTLLFAFFLRKWGWIKDGDLKLQ
ncbi:MAG: PTS sugar transporter subunit IIC [Faecalibacterium sp.]|nr:PTS sugar transporter subunit IIC [Faecalibacterium sp.]